MGLYDRVCPRPCPPQLHVNHQHRAAPLHRCGGQHVRPKQMDGWLVDSTHMSYLTYATVLHA